MTLPAPDIRTKIIYQLLEIYVKNHADHWIKATLFEINYAFQLFAGCKQKKLSSTNFVL